LRNLIAAISITLATLSSVAYAKPKPVVKDRIELQTDYGPVILQNVAVQQGYDGSFLTGTATNNSSRAWRSIAFAVRFRDKKGRDIPTDSLLSNGELSVDQLGKGETKPLTDFIGRSPASLEGLHARVEDFDVQWLKERSFYDSRPIFALAQPAPSRTLSYEDDAISITFSVTNEQLEFTLKNKTQEPQTINWDEVSYIDLDGTAHRVLHKGVKLMDRDKPQSPTVIPPGTRIDDVIEPSDSVQWSSVINDWTHNPLLPPSQVIVNFKGKTFGTFLPIVIDEKKKNYTFTIRIDDVQM
jgi:hypothetical protein